MTTCFNCSKELDEMTEKECDCGILFCNECVPADCHFSYNAANPCSDETCETCHPIKEQKMKTQTRKTHANGARIDDAKKFTKEQKKLIRDNLHADKISFVGEGTQLQLRQGFFYRLGGSTEQCESKWLDALTKLGIKVYPLRNYEATAEHFNPWPRDSYWQVTFMLK